MTKEQERKNRFDKYVKATAHSVKEFYTKPSKTKIDLERIILANMQYYKGTRYRVIAGSCFVFSCGYCFKVNDQWYFRYITPATISDYALSDAEVKELCL